MKIQCSICLGGRRGGVFSNCPYCDHERYTYVEASFNYVCDYLQGLDHHQQNQIINLLNVSQSKS